MAFTPITQVITVDVKKALLDGVPAFRSFTSAEPALQQALLQATQGFQVFTLTIPDVLPTGAGLKGAQLSGWRIAVANGGAAIAGDVYTMARGGKQPLPAGAPRLACIRQGQEVTNMLQTIADLSAPTLADQLPAEPFNVQLLIMPGLYTDALWLQPQTGTTPSYIVPFHTLVANVRLNYAYIEQDIIALLRPIAEKWMSYQPYMTSRATGT
jgi:hypothetical protein